MCIRDSPHTFLYKRYYENTTRNDGVRPTTIETPNEDYNATHAFHEDEDIEDFDTIDDADEALQGLTLETQNGLLTRIGFDTEQIDDVGWEIGMDSATFPTVDDSQLAEYEDAHLDDLHDMSGHQNGFTPIVHVNVNNGVDESTPHEYPSKHDSVNQSLNNIHAQMR